ncbi:MAG: coproporphyrinogen dehydrogenase HemZ [Clostridia bacterium]|nr:coproporphyrinogen dehydrogenase HemZ [Clostridia bacterium]
MILNVEGTSHRYYVETLCMIFFPGSHFSENEKPGESVPEISLTVSREGDKVTAAAQMKLMGKQARGIGEAKPDEEIKDPERIEKIAIGRAVFAAGKDLLGYTNPWGILTGVRPAKVANELLSQGTGVLKAKRILRDEYFLNPKKAALAVIVAVTENKLVKKLPKGLCSVYISIPFCPSRCAYCSFISCSVERLFTVLKDYLVRLHQDIDRVFEVIRRQGLKVATVYIGGGTPTTLSDEELEALLSHITRKAAPEDLLEFTLEAGRPDTITRGKLAIARKYGVTRISVNPQTLNQNVLNAIGRRHTVEQFFEAYHLAEQSGIPNLNVDLIAGLPGDDFSSFAYSVDRVLELSPSNITVHTFCVKKAADIEKNGVYSITGGDVAKCVEYSQLRAKATGYKPYYMYRQKNTVGNQENVGFAKEGTEGYYNVFMMEEMHTVFAVGAGAVTKLVRDGLNGKREIKRIFAPKYPYEYLRDNEKLWNGDGTKLSFAGQVEAFFTGGKEN